MLEAIGLLGGVVTRLFSWGTEYFQKKQDNAHELAMVDKQIALANLQHTQKLEEISAQGNADVDVEWSKALSVALESPKTGLPLIDGLNALVRPVMTFWWCLVLYTISKGFIIYAAVTSYASASQMAATIVSDFDIAVIGSILGFWFCDRALRKASGK